MVSALSEGCRRIGAAELHMVMLEVKRCKSLDVVVELDHTADLKEGCRVVVGIGLEVVVLRKVAVGVEDTPAAVDLEEVHTASVGDLDHGEEVHMTAAVDLGYGEEVHMAAAEVEGILVAGGMDYMTELRTVAGARILPAVVKETADLVLLSHLADSLRVGRRSDLLAHILEEAAQTHRSPAGVGNLVVGILEGIDSAEAADILLPSSEYV